MMREILFRGKRTDKWNRGEWAEGYLDVFEGTPFMLINHDDPYALHRAEVDPDTVGQYTGRKDKNGKRVFEGDILRLFTIWADGTVEPVDVPVIVQFCENDQCYVLTTKQGSHYDDFGNYGRHEYYEVIGNIHDNPELMKEEV